MEKLSIRTNGRYFLLILLALIGCCAVSAQEPRIRTVKTGQADGSTWQQWNGETRLGFVRGYLVGFHVGHRDGCFWYDQRSQPSRSVRDPMDTPLAKCLASAPQFSRTPEEYEAQLTAFYKSYPHDIGLPLDELMRMLSGPENRSLKEIDQLFTAGQKAPE
jgi:hypothetical protein